MLADEHRFFVARRNSGTPLHAQRRRLHGLRPPGVVWDDLQQGRREGRRRYRQRKARRIAYRAFWGTPSHRTGTPSSAFGWITGKARAVNGWLSASRASPLLVRAGGDGLRGKWWTYGAACRRQLRAAADPATDSGASRRVAVLWQGRPERGIGKGLAEASAGLRLRYEFSRQFAPISAWNGRAASDAPRTMCVPKAAVRSRRAGWLACDSGSRT